MTVVPSHFPAHPDPIRMAIIGDAPGIDELRRGEPFVGASGAILNAMLRTANIDRDRLFLGNIFDQKARDNDVEAAGWTRDPTIYEPQFARLNADLEKFAPNIIVPMGDTALWGFTGATGISSARGALAPATRIRTGAKLLPTFHPAFIQKVWKMYVIGVGDLQKAEHEAAFPEFRWPKKRLMVEPTLQEALDWIAWCHNGELLSVDIETGWGLITCVGLGVGADAMCIPFVDMRKPNRSYWDNPEDEVRVWLALRRLLADKSVPKLGQNFSGYDAHWLADLGLPVYNFREDTMLMHHAIYAELEKSLAFLAARYTNTPNWKGWTSHNIKTEKKDDE